MSNKRTIKGDVVLKYCERFAKTPTHTLSRKIYNENKALFKNVEAARQLLNAYRGTHGQKLREEMTEKKYYRPIDGNNPFGLPLAKDIPETKDFHFPYDMYKNGLLLSDIHIPFHDNNVLTLAFEYGLKQKVDFILLLGDIFDHMAFSVFQRDPRKRQFKEELPVGQEFFKTLRRTFPKTAIYFKLGNHDHRYMRWMQEKAPELLDVEEFELERIYGLDELDIKVIGERQRIRYGHLWLIHGHEAFSWYSPVNPAKGIFNKTLTSIVTAHKHRSSMHSEPTMEGKPIVTWSLGCCCLLWPEYAIVNKWDHGFGHLKGLDDGNYEMELKRVYVKYDTKSDNVISAKLF